MLTLTLTLSFVISPLIGFLLYKRLYKWKKIDRIIAAFLPTLLLIILNLLLVQLLSSPDGINGWNAARLAPLFALAKGYNLYYPENLGPVSGYIYGPFGILVYFPALFFESINSVIIVAALISSIVFFVPVVWLHVKGVVGNQALVFSVLLFVGFFLFSNQLISLSYSAFGTHCDAPAMGFAGLACGTIYFRKNSTDQRSLVLTAVLVGLALWSKQTTAPLLPALALYILLTEGRKSFINFLIYCSGFIGLIFIALSLLFEFKPLVFNTFFLPAQHPWIDQNKLIALTHCFQELLREEFILFAILLFSILLAIRLPRQIQLAQLIPLLKQHRWTLFVLTSLLMSITSTLNRAKVGGDVNSFTPAIYFLLIGVTLSLKELYQSSNHANRSRTTRAVQVYTLVLVSLLALGQFKPPSEVNVALNNLPNSASNVAYNLIKAGLGKVYFPFNPLAHVMAEGKLYHFSYGVGDRRLGGFPLSQEHFEQHIPAQVELVISHTQQSLEEVLSYMPDFGRVESKVLPNWFVFARNKT